MSSMQPVMFEHWRHGTEHWGVVITEGPWKDTYIAFKSISDHPTDPLGGMAVDYQVLQKPDNLDPYGKDQAHFESVLQDILATMVERAVNFMKDRNEDRDLDPQQFDPQ